MNGIVPGHIYALQRNQNSGGNRVGKIALITGVTGQDGSYLAELLLAKGYTVHGIVRRSSTFNTERIDHIYQDPQEQNRSFVLHHADLADGVALVNLLRDLQPDEVYNLGAQSHVRVSFDAPLYTGDVTGLSTLRLLEAVRASGSTMNRAESWMGIQPMTCSGIAPTGAAPANQNTSARRIPSARIGAWSD